MHLGAVLIIYETVRQKVAPASKNKRRRFQLEAAPRR